ncbi:MAG: hypothetical protein HOP30_22025 [Cyclobacteriaceae bacterium]|nr:hypothetical protein [Cyclobacteriaceae bacterium]
MKNRFFVNYGGIIVGGLYGLILRIFLDKSIENLVDLFSITFVWIAPMVVALTPLLFATREQLKEWSFRMSRPILSVLTFFVFCYITRLEDIICLIIIAIPFLLVAAITGVILGGLILQYRKNRGILFSVFLLPLITGVIEPNFPSPTEVVETRSSVVINTSKVKVWESIVRVPEIKTSEYTKGFLNFAGVPRPLYAELDKDTLGGNRRGHFEGGLTFKEKIINWEKNKAITFDIRIVPSTSNKSIFERHMLNGQHFEFLNATYQLKELNESQTELSLITTYRLTTKINFYGKFCGHWMLTDFQERLMAVVKNRCENS